MAMEGFPWGSTKHSGLAWGLLAPTPRQGFLRTLWKQKPEIPRGAWIRAFVSPEVTVQPPPGHRDQAAPAGLPEWLGHTPLPASRLGSSALRCVAPQGPISWVLPVTEDGGCSLEGSSTLHQVPFESFWRRLRGQVSPSMDCWPLPFLKHSD